MGIIIRAKSSPLRPTT